MSSERCSERLNLREVTALGLGLVATVALGGCASGEASPSEQSPVVSSSTATGETAGNNPDSGSTPGDTDTDVSQLPNPDESILNPGDTGTTVRPDTASPSSSAEAKVSREFEGKMLRGWQGVEEASQQLEVAENSVEQWAALKQFVMKNNPGEDFGDENGNIFLDTSSKGHTPEEIVLWALRFSKTMFDAAFDAQNEPKLEVIADTWLRLAVNNEEDRQMFNVFLWAAREDLKNGRNVEITDDGRLAFSYVDYFKFEILATSNDITFHSIGENGEPHYGAFAVIQEKACTIPGNHYAPKSGNLSNIGVGYDTANAAIVITMLGDIGKPGANVILNPGEPTTARDIIGPWPQNRPCN